MLPKPSANVKRFDGQKCNTIWDKVITDIKRRI